MTTSRDLGRAASEATGGGNGQTNPEAGDAKRWVLAAAVRAFARHGFDGTGIRDIAREVGTSSAALYHYMRTKDDLLVEIMIAGHEDALRKMILAEGLADDSMRQLAALVATHIVWHVRMLPAVIIDNELRAIPPDRRAPIVALRDEYDAVWQRVINAGIAKGAFTHPMPALARIAIVTMCTEVSSWYSPAGKLSLEEICGAYAAMSLELLGVERARASMVCDSDLVDMCLTLASDQELLAPPNVSPISSRAKRATNRVTAKP